MEEEIDLRPYVQAVARNWMWIVGAAILAALVALAISSRIPPTYEATALVAVTEPRQVVQFDPRIKTTEEIQPLKAYPDLAMSDELLSILLEEIAPIAPEITNLAGLRGLLSAKAGSDPSLINLSASSGNPQVATEIVNKWAEIFVVKANEVFGTQGVEQLSFFEDQLNLAAQELQQVEQNLIDFQARNHSIILENELTALQQTQADQLAMQRQIALLLQDAEGLQEQLEGATNGNEPSSTDQLATILLQLRAFGGVPSADITTPWQLQVNVDQVADTDLQEQVSYLDGLQQALKMRVEQIDTDLAKLEPQILTVQRDKQEADAEESRLNRDLSVAEETYTALARKVEEEKITSQNAGNGVRLASRSAVPEEPSGPRRLVITVVAGFFGALLGTMLVLVKFIRDNAKETADNPK